MESFEDISLEIHSRAEGAFGVRLRTGSQAEVVETFRPPFEGEGLEPFLSGFDLPGVETGRDLNPPRVMARTGPSSRDIGSTLFEALFPGNLRRLFDQSRDRGNEVRPDGSLRGVRLRIRLDLADAEVRPLAALPWELLHDPMTRELYGQGRMRLLVRHLAAPVPVQPLAVSPPLKILAAGASPRGVPHLDEETELLKLETALEKDRRIEVIPLPRASLADTRRALRRERPHILHFMGHGSFDPSNGEGHLLFEGADGEIEPVCGELFSDLLRDFPHVRLVVLNACRTAEMPRPRGLAPYATVGAALSLAGVPAVVAMQFRISDAAAIRFSEAFYEALAEGDPVDLAASEGRRALYEFRYKHRTMEWAAPVLFLRAQDGRIFELPPRAASAGPVLENLSEDGGAMTAPSPTVEGPLLLGIRSREPWGDRPETTLDLRSAFDGRFIRDPALWNAEVYPRLEGFLHDAATSHRPLLLDFAAHATIAFAAGYILEAKSGLDITIRQRKPQGGFHDWKPEDGPLPEGPFWNPEDDLLRDATAPDVAVAVGITHPALDDTLAYLDRNRLPIRRLLPATLAPSPSPQGIRNGAHALALAQALALRIRARTPQERTGTLHLFIAAPNAFLFYLGQLARGLGRIQMYEYKFESGELGGYVPSMLL